MMRISTFICSIMGTMVVTLSLAGLGRSPRMEPPPPLPVDSVSIDNIVDGIIELSRQDTRAVFSEGSERAAHYIAGRLRAARWDVTEHRFDDATRSGGTPVINIEAEYPCDAGSDSILILCAHYDSRADDSEEHAPGADDNASGTAVLLELARVFSTLDAPRIPYHIKMLFFGGEEDSMLGSRHFAERLAAARSDIIGVINVDMVGYDREGPKDFVVFTNKAPGRLAAAIERCADRVPSLRCEITTSDLSNSDHGSFWYRGIHAVSIWEGYDHNPWYHTSHDTPEKLSPAFMASIARVLLCAILRPDPLPRAGSR